MSVRVEPDSAFAAGHASIRVGGAARAAGSPGFRIVREDWDDDKLGPGGWQSSDALLQPDRAEADGPDLVLHIGWGVCRHLEAGVYSFALPAADVAEPVEWPDIAPLHGGTLDVVTFVAPPEPPPPPPPPPVQAPVEPPRPPPQIPSRQDQSRQDRSKQGQPGPVEPPRPPVQPPVAPPPVRPGGGRLTIPLALLLLLLLAGGAGAWWWWHRPAPVVDAQNSSGAERGPGPPVPEPPPLQLGALSVPDVLARAPNPAAVAAEGARRLQADRRDDGLLLLEAAADRGDGSAAASLARLYDPVLFQPGGPIPKADPRQAARYYRDAARAGVDVAAPRDALHRSLEARDQSGDLGANLSLKDFWP